MSRMCYSAKLFLAVLTFLWISKAWSEESYPTATIKNHELAMRVYLPEPTNGFYRGVRFDWSGMIDSVTWQGFRIFGPWQDAHDPLVSDAVVGPAEEFGPSNPPGFKDANPGEGFLKIGVGVLEKPDVSDYEFPRAYRILKGGSWEVQQSESRLTFRHRADAGRGYAYEYEKTISLTSVPPGFLVTHRLKNTGSKKWETEQYCHNLVVFNGKQVGPDLMVTLPFSAKPANAGKFTRVGGRVISFLEHLPPQVSAYAVLEGAQGEVSDFAGKFTDKALGVSLSFQGDQSPTKIVFYAQNRAACLEPFISLKLASQDEAMWTTRYYINEEKAH